MTKADDIQRLVERIEGAGGPDRELDDEIAFAVSAMGEKVPCGHTLNRLTGHKSGIAARRYTASIDAALSLVPERDQRCWAAGWTIDGRAFASVAFDRSSYAATPALAITAAALRARITERTDDDA